MQCWPITRHNQCSTTVLYKPMNMLNHFIWIFMCFCLRFGSSSLWPCRLGVDVLAFIAELVAVWLHPWRITSTPTLHRTSVTSVHDAASTRIWKLYPSLCLSMMSTCHSRVDNAQIGTADATWLSSSLAAFGSRVYLLKGIRLGVFFLPPELLHIQPNTDMNLYWICAHAGW